jgi:hypothetical protein
MQNIAKVDAAAAAEAAADLEFEKFFGPQIWREIEEMSVAPGIVEMTNDLSTDLDALPPEVAAAIQLRRVGRKDSATAALSGKITIDEALGIVTAAQAAASSERA